MDDNGAWQWAWLMALVIAAALCALAIFGWSRWGIAGIAYGALRVQGDFAVSLVTGDSAYGKTVNTAVSASRSAASLIINSAATPNPLTLRLTPAPPTAQETFAGELPLKIVIADAGVSSSVSNPMSQDVGVLENALLSGAVREPASARLGVMGTILIYGHSSYMPQVRNPAYRTFDGVQTLPQGAIIQIYSATAEYRYAVKSVRMVDAENSAENVIPLPADGEHLVIVTCDTFASVSDRFVIDADFIGKQPL